MSGSSFENDEELLTALRELSASIYEDPGYHTPKNIFNQAVTKNIVQSERSSRASILPFKPSTPPIISEEHAYSSLKKIKAPRWDIEALVSQESDEHPTNSKKSRLTNFLATLDSCDYALGIVFLFTIILFFVGIVVLFT